MNIDIEKMHKVLDSLLQKANESFNNDDSLVFTYWTNKYFERLQFCYEVGLISKDEYLNKIKR